MQRHSICSRYACLVRIRLLLRHGTHRKPCVSHHARIIKIKLALMAGTSSGLSGVQRCGSIRPIDRYCCLHSTLAGITIVHVRTRGMFHVSAAFGARTRMLRSAFNVSYLIHARLPIGWRLLCGIPDCAAPYPPSLPASSMHRSYLSSCRCRSQEFAWMRLFSLVIQYRVAGPRAVHRSHADTQCYHSAHAQSLVTDLRNHRCGQCGDEARG